MKVSDLMDELRKCDADSPVVLAKVEDAHGKYTRELGGVVRGAVAYKGADKELHLDETVMILEGGPIKWR